MHFTMNGNCNLCYTVHTCNINVIINNFLLEIKFVISRFHCISKNECIIIIFLTCNVYLLVSCVFWLDLLGIIIFMYMYMHNVVTCSHCVSFHLYM